MSSGSHYPLWLEDMRFDGGRRAEECVAVRVALIVARSHQQIQGFTGWWA